MPYSGIFGLEFKNIIVIFQIKLRGIYPIAKFHEKTKIPKCITKNAFFWIFWVRTWK